MIEVLHVPAMHGFFVVLSLADRTANTFLVLSRCTNAANDLPNFKEFIMMATMVICDLSPRINVIDTRYDMHRYRSLARGQRSTPGRSNYRSHDVVLTPFFTKIVNWLQSIAFAKKTVING
jgi:hypothetical protein